MCTYFLRLSLLLGHVSTVHILYSLLTRTEYSTYYADFCQESYCIKVQYYVYPSGLTRKNMWETQWNEASKRWCQLEDDVGEINPIDSWCVSSTCLFYVT